MVELVVGLVAVLVLFAGLLQLSSLGTAHTEAMALARHEAGQRAMAAIEPSTAPRFIRDWSPGPDGKPYTRDDIPLTVSGREFRSVIVDRATRDPEDWELIDGIAGDRFSRLHHSASPEAEFGLVRGRRAGSVPVMPAVRDLLYRTERIDIECEVWLTWTRGIY
jgi:hypothetical protein